MAKLSQRTQDKLDEVFTLMAEQAAIKAEIERVTKDFRERDAVVAARIQAIEDNIPESQDDAYNAAWMERRRQQS